MALISPPQSLTMKWQYQRGRRSLSVAPTIVDGEHAIGLFLSTQLSLSDEERLEDGLLLARFASVTTAKRFVRLVERLRSCPRHIETGTSPFDHAQRIISDPPRFTGLTLQDLEDDVARTSRKAHENLSLDRARLEISSDWLGKVFTLREPEEDSSRRLAEFTAPHHAQIFRRELSLVLRQDFEVIHQDPISEFINAAGISLRGYWEKDGEALRLVEAADLNSAYVVYSNVNLTDVKHVFTVKRLPESGAMNHQIALLARMLTLIMNADFVELEHADECRFLDAVTEIPPTSGDYAGSFSFRVGNLGRYSMAVTKVTARADDCEWVLEFRGPLGKVALPICATVQSPADEYGTELLAPDALNDLLRFLLNTNASASFLSTTGALSHRKIYYNAEINFPLSSRNLLEAS